MKNDHFLKIEPCHRLCENDHFLFPFHFHFSMLFQAPLQHPQPSPWHPPSPRRHPCLTIPTHTTRATNGLILDAQAGLKQPKGPKRWLVFSFHKLTNHTFFIFRVYIIATGNDRCRHTSHHHDTSAINNHHNHPLGVFSRLLMIFYTAHVRLFLFSNIFNIHQVDITFSYPNDGPLAPASLKPTRTPWADTHDRPPTQQPQVPSDLLPKRSRPPPPVRPSVRSPSSWRLWIAPKYFISLHHF